MLLLSSSKQENGYILLSILLILSVLAGLLLAVFESENLFLRIHHNYQTLQKAYELASVPPDIKTPIKNKINKICYSDLEIKNFDSRIPWQLAWEKNNWREFYFVQHCQNKNQNQNQNQNQNYDMALVWVVGTEKQPVMVMRKKWVRT